MNAQSEQTLKLFASAMTTAKLRPKTIQKRLELLRRLATFLGDTHLLAADLITLREFQAAFADLAPASVNIYTRHVRALYLWAFEVELLDANIAARLQPPRVPKGVPHPTAVSDLRSVLQCAPTEMRLAYVLAAFAGLRCGEIARLRYENLDLDSSAPSAIIDGKGGRQRRVPILAPVVRELAARRRGWVVVRADGRPWSPEALAIESTRFLHSIGCETTMHGMRHFFATMAARLTRDPLLVRDLLGHESVKTTEIYMQSDPSNTHARLADLNALFGDILVPRAA